MGREPDFAKRACLGESTLRTRQHRERARTFADYAAESVVADDREVALLELLPEFIVRRGELSPLRCRRPATVMGSRHGLVAHLCLADAPSHV
jgi:hypothetical protein